MPETAEIVWIDSDMTDAAMTAAQAFLDEHEGEQAYRWPDDEGAEQTPSVRIRRPLQGEACGTYQVWAGSLYHLHGAGLPDELRELTNRAWEHGCQNPAEAVA